MKRKRHYRTQITACILITVWIVVAPGCLQFRISDAKAKAQFLESGLQLETKTITISDFPVHYVKTGNDSLLTLLFIHGSPGSWHAFEDYLKDKDLLAKYRMISVDRPGFGYSRFGDAKNLAQQSQLLSPLIDLFRNNKPFYLIGHSLGGPLATRLFIDHPDHIAGLVLLAASMDPAAEKPEKWRPVLYKTPLQLLVPGAFRPSNKELWYLKADLKEMDSQWQKINCPVWIVHGDKDSFVPVSNVEYMRKKLQAGKPPQITIIPGADHFIPWKNYEQIKKILLSLN